jgi:hypothetical protein
MKLSHLTCGVLLVSLALVAACSQRGAAADAAASGNPKMKASITYLHLLRKTPFFTSLDTVQLRWTIDHSREWEAQPGTVIVDCATSAPKDDIWVLLDGGWQVETEHGVYPAGHADRGKWFSAADASGTCRLVTTEHSYVMKIARTDMDDMLSRGFRFNRHLQTGQLYYRQIFGNGTAPQRATGGTAVID